MDTISDSSLWVELAFKMKDPATVEKFILNDNLRPLSYALTLADGYPSLLLLFSTLQNKGILEDKNKIGYHYILKIKEIIESQGIENLSLFSGLSGICFALKQASMEGKRYKRMLDILNGSLHDRIHKEYLNPLMDNINNNQPRPSFLYDVISGIAGIGRYALENLEDPKFQELSIEITKILVSLSSPYKINGMEVQGWYLSPEDCLNEYQRPALTKGNFNLGLAHGVTGILAFLSIASLRGIKVEGQQEAILRIANWICNKSFVDCETIRWPCSVSWEEEIEKKTHRQESSKDAWCYGVPGISRTLFLAGKALKNEELKNFAIKAFRGIFLRDPSTWKLPGPSLCHGIAGLLIITNAMAKEKEMEDLLKHVNELNQLLVNHYEPIFTLGFKDIETHPEGIIKVNKAGLLEGTTGVLLTLLTLSDPNPLWQLPFLIHD